MLRNIMAIFSIIISFFKKWVRCCKFFVYWNYKGIVPLGPYLVWLIITIVYNIHLIIYSNVVDVDNSILVINKGHNFDVAFYIQVIDSLNFHVLEIDCNDSPSGLAYNEKIVSNIFNHQADALYIFESLKHLDVLLVFLSNQIQVDLVVKQTALLDFEKAFNSLYNFTMEYDKHSTVLLNLKASVATKASKSMFMEGGLVVFNDVTFFNKMVLVDLCKLYNLFKAQVISDPELAKSIVYVNFCDKFESIFSKIDINYGIYHKHILNNTTMFPNIDKGLAWHSFINEKAMRTNIIYDTIKFKILFDPELDRTGLLASLKSEMGSLESYKKKIIFDFINLYKIKSPLLKKLLMQEIAGPDIVYGLIMGFLVVFSIYFVCAYFDIGFDD